MPLDIDTQDDGTQQPMRPASYDIEIDYEEELDEDEQEVCNPPWKLTLLNHAVHTGWLK